METELDATIVKCEILYGGAWGDGPALALVFETADGRTTGQSLFPGIAAVEGLFERLGARVVQDLVGACLRILVLDGAAAQPEVKEVLTSRQTVPDAFRQAFENDA
jgi:hypothetical protein